MTTDNPWPPEGTRVRIRDDSYWSGLIGRLYRFRDHEGREHLLMPTHHVLLRPWFEHPVHRNEIEVIDE